MNIWTLSGNEKYKALSQLYFTDAHAVCLMYSVTDESSFQAIDSWDKFFTDAHERTSAWKPIKYLIALKADVPHNERLVSKEAGERLASERGYQYYECSAKRSYGAEVI